MKQASLWRSYLKVIDNEQDLAQGLRVALYGAGVFGRRFKGYLTRERPDIAIRYYIDSYEKGSLDGVTILGPQELADRKDDFDLIIITSGRVAEISTILDTQYAGVYGVLAADYKFHVNMAGNVSFVSHVAQLSVPDGSVTIIGNHDDASYFLKLCAVEAVSMAQHVVVAPDALAAVQLQPEETVVVLGSDTYRQCVSQLEGCPAHVAVLDDSRIGNQGQRLAKEIDIQREIWVGGYREGDPLDPLSPTKYQHMGWLSSAYVVYLTAIRPYIHADTVALEIGCGGGAWSKAIATHAPRELWCVDVLSAEQNRFWANVEQKESITYLQVNDFSCSAIPDNHFDYFFSFGCFCHLSFEAISEYMTNIYPKLKSGARCILMVADYDKFNRAYRDHHENLVHLVPTALQDSARDLCLRMDRSFKDKNENMTPGPGRWFHAGVDRTCTMLESIGFSIVERDMNTNIRDPLIHFMKR